MSVSILDVAKYAGVSKSTVSRVLTGGSVSEKAERAVMQAIKELNYYPNGIARGLRGASSQVIGVLGIDSHALFNKSLSTRLAGINSILSQAGYSLVLINSPQMELTEEFEKGIRFLEEKRVDGLILLGDMDDEVQKEKMKEYRPIVYTGERVDIHKGFRVYMGNYQYSRDAYSYLLANGHKKILTVMVYHSSSNKMKERRWLAYQEMCRTYQLQDEPDDFLDLRDKKICMPEKLAQAFQLYAEKKATALFVDSVDFANSLINYFSERGLELRKDYSVVAVERGVTAETKDALITAVSLPDFDYGRQCGQLMMEVIRDQELSYMDVSVPYTFEIRRSVRNICGDS